MLFIDILENAYLLTNLQILLMFQFFLGVGIGIYLGTEYNFRPYVDGIKSALTKIEKRKDNKKKSKVKKQKVSKSILDGRTEEFNNIKLFFDKLDGVDAKNLRQLVDECKKDIKSGIVCLIATYEGKSSIAIGVTNDLLNNYDAVNLVKTSSEILGGKGGGGRKDMALAGAKDVSKSEDVFEQLLKEIKKDS